jgi:hypothetical protein
MRDGPRHQSVCHLQCGSVWFQPIVDPAGEHRRFRRRTPRLWQRLHPTVQIHARGRESILHCSLPLLSFTQ